MATLQEIRAALRTHASPKKTEHSKRFFKTGPGEYGEGDRFLGVTVPEQRAIARRYNDLSIDKAFSLLQSAYHEERLTALFILNDLYKQGSPSDRKEIYTRYLTNISTQVNNWDLVDSSAHKIVGEHLLTRPRTVLRRLARSKNLWERRVAVIATLRFIGEKQYDDTVELATMLLDDPEDLMHKAVGWMLREAGKRQKAVLVGFLEEHAHQMPRTMLRYAIERLSPRERKRYMNR